MGVYLKMSSSINRDQIMTFYWGLIFGGSFTFLIAGTLNYYIELDDMLVIILAAGIFCVFLAFAYLQGTGRISIKISETTKILSAKGFLLGLLIVFGALLISWPFNEIFDILIQALGMRECPIAAILMIPLAIILCYLNLSNKFRLDEGTLIILLAYVPLLFVLTILLSFSFVRILSIVIGVLASFYFFILLTNYHFYTRHQKLEDIWDNDIKLELKFFNIGNDRVIRLFVIGGYLWIFVIILFLIRFTSLLGLQ